MIFNYILNSAEEIQDYFNNDFKIDKINVDEINLHRTHAFKIQAFGRIVKRAFKKSDSSVESEKIKNLGEAIKLSGKFIEDSIGNYLYHLEMKPSAKNDDNLLKAVETLKKDTDFYKDHIDIIKKSYFILKESDLKEIYLKGLLRELKKIREDISLIDSNLLEDGTHELRRKLRWIIMYVIYPEGLFKYIEENPKTNKYTKLKPNQKYKPVLIPFKIMDYLSTSVYDLGKLKDEGLLKNYNRPHEEINISSELIIKKTQNIIDEIKSKKYVKKLRTAIKDFL